MGNEGPDKAEEQPKIVVDEDWKAQAEAEKERLAAGADAPPGGGAAAGRGDLPPANFLTLVSSLMTQVLFALGALQDPRGGRRPADPALAKHHVDTLAMLEEKTRGNLTDEEKEALDGALYEARMAYVRVAQGGA